MNSQTTMCRTAKVPPPPDSYGQPMVGYHPAFQTSAAPDASKQQQQQQQQPPPIPEARVTESGQFVLATRPSSDSYA